VGLLQEVLETVGAYNMEMEEIQKEGIAFTNYSHGFSSFFTLKLRRLYSEAYI
jgi:hypothetical protein